MLKAALFYDPVVKRPVSFVFERAERMRYALYCVLYRMSKVVHGIYAPFVARLVVTPVKYSVKRGIAQVYIGRGHVYFCSERARTVLKFTCAHTLKQIKVFFYASVSERAVLAGLGQRAAVFTHFVLGKVAHIRVAVFY